MLRLVPFRYTVARQLDGLDPWTEGLMEVVLHGILFGVAAAVSIFWPMLIITAMDRLVGRSVVSQDEEQDADPAPKGVRSAWAVPIVAAEVLVIAAGIFYVWLAFVGVVVAGYDIAASEDAARAKLVSAVSEASTDAELADLLASGESSVDYEIAVHASTGPTTQRYLALNAKEWVLVEMASEAERLWPTAGRLLAQDESDDVREAYANRTNDADPVLLVGLLHDKSHDVAVAAFKNPLTPRLEKCGIVQEILEGSDGYEHYVDEIGEMVDYCRSVTASLDHTSDAVPSAE